MGPYDNVVEDGYRGVLPPLLLLCAKGNCVDRWNRSQVTKLELSRLTIAEESAQLTRVVGACVYGKPYCFYLNWQPLNQ